MARADSRGPTPALVGAPLSALYRLEVARRNRAFDRGRGVTRLGVPVISVGNLSVGGTGKTPHVMVIVQWLLDAGARPVIAMRGYKKRGAEHSDEQAEYAQRFVGVPIVAQPDRLAGLRPLLDAGAVDVVVLDDGFQHRRIARDVDIVLIDATRDLFADRCLPAGWLREPVSSLSRATHAVLTHCECADDQSIAGLGGQIRAIHPELAVAESLHEWTALRDGDSSVPLSEVRDTPVVAGAGIGNPGAFLEAARRAGADVLGTLDLADHHTWTAADLARARALGGEAPTLLTSEKDWVKIRAIDDPGIRVLRPKLEICFREGQNELHRSVIGAVRAPSPA